MALASSTVITLDSHWKDLTTSLTSCTGRRVNGNIKLACCEVGHLGWRKCKAVDLSLLAAQGEDFGSRCTNQGRSVDAGGGFVTGKKLSVGKAHAELGARECEDRVTKGRRRCACCCLLCWIHESEESLGLCVDSNNRQESSEKSGSKDRKIHDCEGTSKE